MVFNLFRWPSVCKQKNPPAGRSPWVQHCALLQFFVAPWCRGEIIVMITLFCPDGRRSVTKDLDSKRESRLPSLESIKLEPVDSEDVSTTTRSRRRSLLDMTQSPKPTLLMKDRQNLQDSGQASKAEPPAENKKGESIKFRMPSGSQLSNLCKIQVGGWTLS